jgi:uncharacterized C2H2 Zn-finger protein
MLLLGAAIQPVVPGTKVGYMASLDHSMWFHNPFRAHEWMLYEIECPQCGMYLFINRYYGGISHINPATHWCNFKSVPKKIDITQKSYITDSLRRKLIH